MTRFLTITFCTSLAIFAGGLIAMMIDAVSFAPWPQTIIAASGGTAMVSLFLLEQSGALSK
jgi:hypothetical protein